MMIDFKTDKEIINELTEKLEATQRCNDMFKEWLVAERNEVRRLQKEMKAYIDEMEAYCNNLEAKLIENTTIEPKEAVQPSKGQIIKKSIDDGVCIFDNASMAKGKRSEDKAAKFLANQGYNVYDMSDDKEYRKKDIDFILEKDGVQTTLEVKNSSSAKYGTVWIEDVLNIKKNKPGWIHYCQADYLAAVGKGMMYFYKTDEMLDYINEVKSGQATYKPQERIQDDPKFKGEQSLIYGVNMKDYASTGRYVEKINTKGRYN